MNTDMPAGVGPVAPRALACLVTLACIFFLNFVSRIVIAPLLPQVMEDLSMGAAEAANLFFIMSWGYFVSLLLSAIVASWLTHRTTIVVSCLVLSGAMLGLFLADSPLMLEISMAALGLGAGLYLPSAIATITSIFPEGRWGRAIAVHELAPNLAFVSAPAAASVFMYPFGWQRLAAGLAVALLALAVVIRFTGAGGLRPSPPRPSIYLRFLSKGQFWLMMVLFALGVLGTLGVFNVLPLYLVTVHGFGKAEANTLISLSRIATLGTALAGGFLTDRMGPRRTMMLVFAVTGLATIGLGMLSGDALQAMVFLQPLFAVAFFPAAFAAMSGLAQGPERAIVVSLLASLAFLEGAGAVPALIGWLAERGLFSQGMIGAGVALMTGVFLAWRLDRD